MIVMKTNKKQNKLILGLVICLGMFFLTLPIGAKNTDAQIIPPDRRIDWNPGIPGGIPPRTTISATVVNGDGDDTNAIQSAIDQCPEGGVVFLPAGIYSISSTIRFSKGIVLRGEGPEKTIIQMTSSGPQHVFRIGTYVGSFPQVPLIGEYAKGSTTLTINTSDSDESLFTVGKYILVGQSDGDNPLVILGDCTWGKMRNDIDNDLVSLAQIVKITGRQDNTITISPGLYYPRESQYHPFIARFDRNSQPVIINAGIEDMKIERTERCGYQGSILDFWNCIYSWVKNVETVRVCGRHIRFNLSYGCEIRDSYWHEAWTYTSGGVAYGMCLRYYSSANLVTNNIGSYLNGILQFETTGGGNVVSYNYFDGTWLDESNPNWQLRDVGSHCSHPYMDLVEGNYMTKFHLDATHGSSSHYTVFRNYIDTDHTFALKPDHPYDDTDLTGGVRLDLGFYTNVVGNVIGQESYPHGPTVERYKCEPLSDCGAYQSSRRHMYIFRTDNQDVFATTLLHGNFDYFNNETIWDPTISNQTLLDSYYLTEKPSFFGDLPWPPIGPDVNPMVNNIPAKERFDAIINKQNCSGACCTENQRCVGTRVGITSDCSNCCDGTCEEAPLCPEGAINPSGCNCGGMVYYSGYCCDNVHQDNPCSSTNELSQPSDLSIIDVSP